MKSFLAACIIAGIIAAGAAVLLNEYHTGVEMAFTTTGARN